MPWKRIEKQMPTVVLAAVLMVFSGLLYAVNMGIIRVVSADVHPFVIAFFRNFFAVMFLLPWLVRGKAAIFRTNRLNLHVGRAFIQVMAMVTWFTAISLMPLADVTSVMFTAPTMVGMGAVLLFGEKMGIRRWSAGLIGLAGALIILRPGFENGGWHAAVALSAALSWAALTLTMKSLTRYDSVGTIVSFNLLLATPLALIGALFFWQWPSYENLMWMALQGGLGAIAQASMTRAMSLADASYVITFDFLRLPFAAVIGYVAFAELLDPMTLAGSAVIIASTAYFVHRERVIQRQQEQAKTAPPADSPPS
jgi:drug/metabolite transporter (DMT)-like permease